MCMSHKGDHVCGCLRNRLVSLWSVWKTLADIINYQVALREAEYALLLWCCSKEGRKRGKGVHPFYRTRHRGAQEMREEQERRVLSPALPALTRLR